MKQEQALATFGGGCFWGVEEAFRTLSGVLQTSVGYMGGTTIHPTYEEVCSGTTDHAEVVQVVFNPEKISYDELLNVFWRAHNPTTRDRQGPDVGTQYRSVIFTHTDEQKRLAEASKAALDASGRYASSIVTEILPAQNFFLAEEYHQQYHAKHGGSCSF